MWSTFEIPLVGVAFRRAVRVTALFAAGDVDGPALARARDIPALFLFAGANSTFQPGGASPWQKGSVESFNRRARRYLPRDTQLMALSNRSMMAICERLNGTPRKCLGYRTPTEAFREELRKLK